MDMATVVSLIAKHGGNRDAQILYGAIARAERSFNSTELGDTTLEDATWGPSVGIFQIRSLKAQFGTGQPRDASRLEDPDFCTNSASIISEHWTNPHPWSTFGNGDYEAHLSESKAAVVAQEPSASPPTALPTAVPCSQRTGNPPGGRRILQLESPMMNGNDVADVQARLFFHGHAPRNSQRPGGSWDGFFGPGTRQAVTEFQGSIGLVADGIVGVKTYCSLGIE